MKTQRRGMLEGDLFFGLLGLFELLLLSSNIVWDLSRQTTGLSGQGTVILRQDLSFRNAERLKRLTQKSQFHY